MKTRLSIFSSICLFLTACFGGSAGSGGSPTDDSGNNIPPAVLPSKADLTNAKALFLKEEEVSVSAFGSGNTSTLSSRGNKLYMLSNSNTVSKVEWLNSDDTPTDEPILDSIEYLGFSTLKLNVSQSGYDYIVLLSLSTGAIVEVNNTDNSLSYKHLYVIGDKLYSLDNANVLRRGSLASPSSSITLTPMNSPSLNPVGSVGFNMSNWSSFSGPYRKSTILVDSDGDVRAFSPNSVQTGFTVFKYILFGDGSVPASHDSGSPQTVNETQTGGGQHLSIIYGTDGELYQIVTLGSGSNDYICIRRINFDGLNNPNPACLNNVDDNSGTLTPAEGYAYKIRENITPDNANRTYVFENGFYTSSMSAGRPVLSSWKAADFSSLSFEQGASKETQYPMVVGNNLYWKDSTGIKTIDLTDDLSDMGAATTTFLTQANIINFNIVSDCAIYSVQESATAVSSWVKCGINSPIKASSSDFLDDGVIEL